MSEMYEWKFVFKGTPVPKDRPRATVINGHAVIYTPRRTHSFEIDIAVQAREQHPDKRLLNGPISLSVKFFLPYPMSYRTKPKMELVRQGLVVPSKKPDLDNLTKTYLDALNGVLWIDDCQIISMLVSKEYTLEEEGYTELTVTGDSLVEGKDVSRR